MEERTDCETNQLNEKSESIGIDSEPNILSDTNSQSDYLICSSEQKPDFKPKHGVLELVSILSTESNNSYKSLYRFKTDD